MELYQLGDFNYSREHVAVIFGRDSSIQSRFVRTMLWSEWSHCGIVDHDVVIEAQPSLGVVERPVTDFMDAYPNYGVIRIPTQNSKAVIDTARSQLGKGYDWLGVLGIAARHRYAEDTQAWFCSELIAWSFEHAGSPLFTKKPWRVTPADIALPTYTY